MKGTLRVVAYTGAALTIVATALTPFVLLPLFTRGVAALGLRTDAVYSGGEPARTFTRPGYRIIVYHPVVPRAPLAALPPFVQVAWEPASALPARIADEVDVDDDGRADLRAEFGVPVDESAPLRADVTSLSPRVPAARNIGRDSFARLIARAGDRIVLRVPIE